MRYYQIIPDSDVYDSLRMLSEDSLEILQSIDGNKILYKWTPPPVGLVKMKKRGDFLSMSVVAVSEKAWLILKPIIEDSVEALPLQCKSGTFYAINVVVRAALDLDKAKVDRFSDGEILRIKKYSFKKDTITGRDIFLPEEIVYSDPIVSEIFKEMVEANGLEGLIFKEVWQNDES